LLFAPTALAERLGPDGDSTFLNAGLLLSATSRPAGFEPGMGVEVSLHRFFDKSVGAGFFGQWQTMELKHHRICGGLQASFSVAGLELGATHETASDERAATTSLHVAPFVSVGVLMMGVRFGFPIAQSEGNKPGHGSDVGFVMAIKYPLDLD
jgi:hypothetical protein